MCQLQIKYKPNLGDTLTLTLYVYPKCRKRHHTQKKSFFFMFVFYQLIVIMADGGKNMYIRDSKVDGVTVLVLAIS